MAQFLTELAGIIIYNNYIVPDTVWTNNLLPSSERDETKIYNRKYIKSSGTVTSAGGK